MSEIPNPIGAPRPDATAGAAGSPARSRQAASPEAGVAFKALLERLEAHTRELEVRGQAIEDADGLAGALDTARASLEDAVSLGDRLLEAYRERLLQQGAEQEQAPQTDKENRR